MTFRSDAALVALRRIIRATELDSRALAKQSGLTPSQLLLLQMLAKEGAMTAGAIAKSASLSQATVTALLDKLEARGLLRRARDTADRRRVFVELTEAGRLSETNAPGLLQERFEKRFGKLQDWEQAFLIAALEKTAALLDAEDIDAAPVLYVGTLNEAPDMTPPRTPKQAVD